MSYHINKTCYKSLIISDNYREVKADVEKSVMLSLNDKLYNGGHITEEMYIRAKDMIIKGGC